MFQDENKLPRRFRYLVINISENQRMLEVHPPPAPGLKLLMEKYEGNWAKVFVPTGPILMPLSISKDASLEN